MTEYKVKLPVFEGPLDLLLHLIRQNELEISEISISQITSQYLEYMRLMEALDLELAGDFLVMAATLLNVKLRALLPASEEEEQAEQEEELDNFMSARQLMAKLIEYRKFKEAAHDLGNRAERQAQIFVREVALPAIAEAQKDEAIRGDIDVLLQAFSRVLRFVERRNFHEVKNEEYTVDEKIVILRGQLVLEPRLELTALFEQCHAKVEMIVLVLAILELCRLKELRVRQNDRFGEVFIFRQDSAPEAEYETTQGNKKLTAAAALERIEAEIIANRTGVIDDGELPPDSEERMIEELLAQDAQAQSGRSAMVVAANPEATEVLQTPEFESVADGDEPTQAAAGATPQREQTEYTTAEIVELHPAEGEEPAAQHAPEPEPQHTP